MALSLVLTLASTALAQHQIVCSGKAAGGYAAFADICRLPTGELFCVFYSGYGHISTPNAKWPKGGRIMAQGTPEQTSRIKKSYTGQALAHYFNGNLKALTG